MEWVIGVKHSQAFPSVQNHIHQCNHLVITGGPCEVNLFLPPFQWLCGADSTIPVVKPSDA